MNRVFKEIQALKAHKEIQGHKANKEFKAMSDLREFKEHMVCKEFKAMSDHKEFKEHRVSKEFKVISDRKESRALLAMMAATDFYRMAQPLEIPLFGMALNGSLMTITFLIQEGILVLG